MNKIKITKAYFMKLGAFTSPNDHNVEIFFDYPEELFKWKTIHWPDSLRTYLYISGVERDKPIYEQDGFMKRDEMRAKFYECMLDKENIDFINAQHSGMSFYIDNK